MLIVFLGIVVANQTVMTTMRFSGDEQRIDQVLTQIATAADRVYIQGSGARMQVPISLPESIGYATVNGVTLEFVMFGNDGVEQVLYRSMRFPVNGTLPQTPGKHWVTVEAMEGYVKVS